MTDVNAQTTAPPASKVLGGLTPYLQLDGALKAAEFYSHAFGAEQVLVYPPDEKGRTMHVHLHINGSSLMISDAFPEHGHPHRPIQGCTMQLHLANDTIERWWQRAVDAGCKVVAPLEIMFWGDRWGLLRDPFAVEWGMNAPVEKT